MEVAEDNDLKKSSDLDSQVEKGKNEKVHRSKLKNHLHIRIK